MKSFYKNERIESLFWIEAKETKIASLPFYFFKGIRRMVFKAVDTSIKINSKILKDDDRLEIINVHGENFRLLVKN